MPNAAVPRRDSGARWASVALRAAALLDALMLVPLLSPRIGAAMFGLAAWTPGADCRFVMGVAAALMLGWTCLLLWADRRPVERRGVLLLTALPVVPALAAACAYAVASGFVSAAAMAPTRCAQAAIEGLLILGYVRSARADSDCVRIEERTT